MNYSSEKRNWTIFINSIDGVELMESIGFEMSQKKSGIVSIYDKLLNNDDSINWSKIHWKDA